MSSITIHLVRHGEVDNPNKVLYGRLPGFGLSALGHRMAEGIAHYFQRRAEQSGQAPCYLVASPLQRAAETAQPLSQALDLDVVTDERVIEAENRFEGLSHIAEQLKNPRWWPLLVNPFQPSWGEPYKAQVARMQAAIYDAHTQAAQRGGDEAEAVIVSHQLPIWVTRLSAENKPLWHDPRQRECTLTSVTSLHFAHGLLQGISYAEPNAHLLVHAANLPGA